MMKIYQLGIEDGGFLMVCGRHSDIDYYFNVKLYIYVWLYGFRGRGWTLGFANADGQWGNHLSISRGVRKNPSGATSLIPAGSTSHH